jgi:hypothetical protein
MNEKLTEKDGPRVTAIVPCPQCGAGKGVPCPGGIPHPERVASARRSGWSWAENTGSQKPVFRRFLGSWAGVYFLLLACVDFGDWLSTVLFGSQRYHPSVQDILVVSTVFILLALQELASRIESVGTHPR